MALSDDLDLYAPHLYRFACALIFGHPGPSAQTDLVRAILLLTLEGSLAARLTGDNLRIRLYGVLIEWHRDGRALGSIGSRARAEIDNFHIAKQNIGKNTSLIASTRDNFSAALLDLGLEEREAFLLVALEDFDYGQAARILNISRSVLLGRLARARAALSQIVPVESSMRPVKTRPSYLRLVK